ncbi:glycosyltransferase [Ideonella sp. A 288]|uniref:glycosyltransferase n=1 Tax=Ideonella sp. A 288 TaxID=1962181 RepID=UPI000B4B8623|nr:glycosyltransferase [Ideonella sp. A 288]
MVPSSHDTGRPIGLLVKIFPKLSETFILEEVLGLEKLGVPLRLYALAAPTDAVSHPAVDRVKARVTLVPAKPWRDGMRFVRRHLGLLAASPWRYLQGLQAAMGRGNKGLTDFARAGWLAGQMRDDGVAHLHTHFISTPADVAELVSQISGVPFSISAHAKDIYLSDAADLRRKMGAARFTVTCTEFNCRTLREIAPDANVQRMYHGIDGGAFHPSCREKPSLVPLILSVGRLREKKGLDTLIEACRLLQGRGVPFRCEIVGYGEEQQRLANLIEACGLGDQVQLTGKLTREHVIARYGRAAVYVQPSRVAADGDRDGIPNVLLEAMAVGVPVVATRVSGIPEVVHHRRNGLLVEPDDPAALADAIAHLIESPALGVELGRAARSTVTEHFDNDRNLRLVLQLLETPHAHAESCAVA